MNNHKLIKILIAIMLAIVVGSMTGNEATLLGIRYVDLYGLAGQLFLNALSLVVIPLVSASIITSTARMGGEPSFALLGAKMFGFYLLIAVTAVLVGLCGFMLLSPGAQMNPLLLEHTANLSLPSTAGDPLARVLFKIVPANIISAAAQGEMLGVITFSLLFGFFLSRIDPQPAALLLGFWNGVLQVMMKMVHLIMRALPLGVFALVAKMAATIGAASLPSIALYFLMIVASLLCYAFAVLPFGLWLFSRVHPLAYFKAIAPALLTAFSTSSSVASLPITMECMEKRVGISNRICAFTLPLGTSLNMSGCALYLCAASLFIAQVYGHTLAPSTLCLVALMSVLTSMGIAGIPSASLISLMMILQTIGVPVEGVGLIMAVDRVLDMFRTTVNVLGNASCAVLLASSEGERELLDKHPAYMQT